MKLKKISFPFLVILLEWYEFTIYNSLIPYGIFGGTNEVALYIGFAIFGLSFLARPLGAFYFSSLPNRTKSLKLSLAFMSISTILIALSPSEMYYFKPLWFGLCKAMQGFALGGSYGLAYLSVYESEEQKKTKRTNYKLALIQTGWVWGMLIGELTIFLLKLTFGNLDLLKIILSEGSFTKLGEITPSASFISWGWRIPFLVSGGAGCMLYSTIKDNKDENLPCNDTVKYTIRHVRKNPWKFASIFLVVAIDMVVFHMWFTYYEVYQEASQTRQLFGLIPNIRRVLLIILFPLFGRLTDILNANMGRNYGNYLMLFLVCISISVFSIVATSPLQWIIISSATAAACYGSLIAWTMAKFDAKGRQIIIGPLFNLVSAVVGSTLPLSATYVATRFGQAQVAWLSIFYSIMSLAALSLNLLYDFRQKGRGGLES